RGGVRGRLAVSVAAVVAQLSYGQATCESNGSLLPICEPPCAPAGPSKVVEDGEEYRWASGFESVGWSSMVRHYEYVGEPHTQTLVELPSTDIPKGFRLGINLRSS